ncbi:MAG: DUF4136 domain-containing protein [Burkholderiales bacterium]|nr:DUF4136 domain-containing protein [Burkholderiales bacterium]
MNTRTGLLVLCATLLGGCASIGTLNSDVSSYGQWPAGRQPGTYAFERLPSQQARPAAAERLEAAARGALAQAGFQPAAGGQAPDVLVQLGSRENAEAPIWVDPVWWQGGFRGRWGGPYWGGPYWGGPYWGDPFWGGAYYYGTPRYALEAALLIRDRATGKPLYETHASTDSFTRADAADLAALFDAAMVDFPHVGLNPRRVTVPIGQPAPPASHAPTPAAAPAAASQPAR